MKLPSVRLSVLVRLSHRPAATRRCGGFAAVGPPARRLLHGRRSAANASSVTLPADVGS